MENPEISVIVPIFNAEENLAQCIESILAQTYNKFELILINDGSIDSSPEICKRYLMKDRRIKLLNKINGGVSSARNEGIRYASGQYICFIDSDDWIDTNYLMSFFINSELQKKSLYIQGYTEIYPDGTSIGFGFSSKNFYKPEDIPIILSRTSLIKSTGPVVKLFDLELIKQENLFFPEDMSFGEDTLFFYEYLLYIERCFISLNNGYFYRKFWSNSSLTVKKYSFDYYVLFRNRLILIIEKIIKRYGLPDGINYFYPVYSYSVFLLFNALYHNDSSYIDRKNVLKEINNYNLVFQKKTKFLALINLLSKFPIFLEDLLLQLYFCKRK